MIRVGIFFGGSSREREVSFAGGRTVYDNLNKNLFKPVPIFVDSFGNFCLLDWEYIYKGSIRDFYPPVAAIQHLDPDYQVYAEHLGELSYKEQIALLKPLGKILKPHALKAHIDMAFLALHGQFGEDGTIQGLLEWYGIPFTGAGLFSSAFALDKSLQKKWLPAMGFETPRYAFLSRKEWVEGDLASHMHSVSDTVGFPCVVKASTQGSSIGVAVIASADPEAFRKAVDKAFFRTTLTRDEWKKFDKYSKIQWVKTLSDIRSGTGLPALVNGKAVYQPEKLIKAIDKAFIDAQEVVLESFLKEQRVIFEQFIEGREFSCIVVDGPDGQPIALPPTGIVKQKEVFDYRSKYLPGLSRKVTPIDATPETIAQIRSRCESLYTALQFEVYARIDGFILEDGRIYLNDPNTTSGMMPSSFFFHQAAEIGLNPSEFLTFVIHASLNARARTWNHSDRPQALAAELKRMLSKTASAESHKDRVAVVMGGYSSERHISVESGRNIFEKLASSVDFIPIPIFLTGDEKAYRLFVLPINLMLKDNADDIRDKVLHPSEHPAMADIRNACAAITQAFAMREPVWKPIEVNVMDLPDMVDSVFIALHGRPGEDGTLQKDLEQVGLSYNGSGPQSSAVTINKFETNNFLRENGFHVANNHLVTMATWNADPEAEIAFIEKHFTYPFIAKPADDGCSSAVKKIKDRADLQAFAQGVFRDTMEPVGPWAEHLQLKPKEEFPRKAHFLIEQLVEKGDATHFLEITGGFLTHLTPDGELEYEMFEPSETLAEGAILSLEEKFLAGEGQNITPARYSSQPEQQKWISAQVRKELKRVAKVLNIQGYARIDAFVKVFGNNNVEVVIIEVNSLPGMTPATCIFHQCALNGYKPSAFIQEIISFGKARAQRNSVS